MKISKVIKMIAYLSFIGIGAPTAGGQVDGKPDQAHKLEASLKKKGCSVAIQAGMKASPMSYDLQEIKLKKSCAKVLVTLSIPKDGLPRAAMGHNLVIAPESKRMGIITAGLSQGLAKEYLAADKAGTGYLYATAVLGPGQSHQIVVDVKMLEKHAGKGPLAFFCTFPGHSSMKGKIVFM